MSDLTELQEEILSLCAQARDWGRHHQKSIGFLERAARSLAPALAGEGLLRPLAATWQDRQPPASPPLPLSSEEPAARFHERVQLFHGLHLLRLHRDTLSALAVAARQGPLPPAAVRALLVEVESRYEWVSRAAMSALLEQTLRGSQVPSYALLNVGTSLHLDDIDVGAIAAADSEPLNRALSVLAGEMIRRVSRLHFYLAEQLGTDTYYATVQRYRQWMDKGVRNYVAVSELLNARLICGDASLYARFMEEVGGRFYYALGREAAHYAYVRGILTEVRALFRQQEEESFSINFKRDAIRAIRALVSAESTRYGVRAGSVWEALDALRQGGDRLRDLYQGLEETLAFIELFRHLYQLFVVQEEHLALSDEEVLATLDPLARLMGYEEIRHIRPGNRLLLEYNVNLIRSRRLVQSLLEQERVYVRTLYVFGRIARGGRFLPSLAEIRGNLGREFLEVVRSFRGTAFWQDILQLLTNIDRDSLRRFADDLLELPDARELVERYVRLVAEEPHSLIRLLLVIGEHRDSDRISRMFWMFVDAWLERLRRKVPERERLLSAFREAPDQFLRLLYSLDQPRQVALHAKLGRPVRRRELVPVRRRLLHLLALVTHCSRFFERTLRQVASHHPHALGHLEDGAWLARSARACLARALQGEDVERAFADARLFYQIEFVRLGSEILAGRRIPVLLREFRRMLERSVETLAVLCRRRLQAEGLQAGPEGELGYAILATGGNAREEGYLADYDTLFLAREDSRSIELAQRLAVHFNAEITRMGVLPHHLFADALGRFAVTLPDLLGFLRQRRGEDFVERSEILGSRLVHGGAALHQRFLDEVVRDEVLAHKDSYLRAMLADAGQRRAAAPVTDDSLIRLKSDRGSLREIHLALDLLRARFGIIESIPRRLFPKLVGADPARQADYFALVKALNFLIRLRVLYQLAVGHETTIDPALTEPALAALRIGAGGKGGGGEALLERYRSRTALAARAIDRLTSWLASELGVTVDSASSSDILGLESGPVER
jgi:hypothetical protein